MDQFTQRTGAAVGAGVGAGLGVGLLVVALKAIHREVGVGIPVVAGVSVASTLWFVDYLSDRRKATEVVAPDPYEGVR